MLSAGPDGLGERALEREAVAQHSLAARLALDHGDPHDCGRELLGRPARRLSRELARHELAAQPELAGDVLRPAALFLDVLSDRQLP